MRTDGRGGQPGSRVAGTLRATGEGGPCRAGAKRAHGLGRHLDSRVAGADRATGKGGSCRAGAKRAHGPGHHLDSRVASADRATGAGGASGVARRGAGVNGRVDLRVACPGGIIGTGALRTVAELSGAWGIDRLTIGHRQDLLVAGIPESYVARFRAAVAPLEVDRADAPPAIPISPVRPRLPASCAARAGWTPASSSRSWPASGCGPRSRSTLPTRTRICCR